VPNIPRTFFLQHMSSLYALCTAFSRYMFRPTYLYSESKGVNLSSTAFPSYHAGRQVSLQSLPAPISEADYLPSALLQFPVIVAKLATMARTLFQASEVRLTPSPSLRRRSMLRRCPQGTPTPSPFRWRKSRLQWADASCTARPIRTC